jgi:hypothetical protein
MYANSHGHQTYFRYQDGEAWLRYPMTYGVDYIDTFYATSIDPDDGSITYRNGSLHVTCDGYGTLYLPTANRYDNVLRVKQVENFVDSNAVHPGGVSHVSNIFYRWYLSGTRHPLFEDEQFTIDSTVSYFADYLDSSNINYVPLFTSIDEDPSAINPLIWNYENTIVLDNLPPDSRNFNLYNSCGQMVYTANLNGGQQRTFYLPDLCGGLYIAQLVSATAMVSKKLVIDK